MKNKGIELPHMLNSRSKKDNSIVEVAETIRSDDLGYSTNETNKNIHNEKDIIYDKVEPNMLLCTEILKGISADIDIE
ncbi:hypothetical protein AYI70_g4010 [Smittium culicis]|uniref:Uncharacterized protein n=1 Tax=Smittium culicis TaxID=133412 RepID=A0A1R1Y111_9FUNG|nr:hypothetical protein AYI70_g4010 [Smittium culicis]